VLLGTLLVGSLSVASCTDDEPTLSEAEILAAIEGRELSEAEVAEREQVAAALCRMDDAVLIEIWSQLDNDQLEFQDFVFSRSCPERNGFYAESTGRFTDDE
jgi:hypothetical protein